MTVKTAFKRADKFRRQLEFACSDIEYAIQKEYGVSVRVSYNQQDYDIEFPDGEIWETGTAMKILQEEYK